MRVFGRAVRSELSIYACYGTLLNVAEWETGSIMRGDVPNR